MISAGLAAQLACLWEAAARKPGNVTRCVDFPGLTFLDLAMSAAAIAPEIERAAGRPVGATILACIEATRRVVATNTNLGIVLLLAPLAAGDDLDAVLHGLTVEDAELAYRAIRLARPGGLGTASRHDVANAPVVTLRDAMAAAADRDLIARQYVTGYSDVMAGTDVLTATLARAGDLEAAIIDLQRFLLARAPDSLIGRKRGPFEADELMRLARTGADLAAWFAAGFPHRNPGTTADLIAACLFVALRRAMITLPLSPPWPPILP
jgi:triphosphoribosyl-dephospho-CoA synthase